MEWALSWASLSQQDIESICWGQRAYQRPRQSQRGAHTTPFAALPCCGPTSCLHVHTRRPSTTGMHLVLRISPPSYRPCGLSQPRDATHTARCGLRPLPGFQAVLHASVASPSLVISACTSYQPTCPPGQVPAACDKELRPLTGLSSFQKVFIIKKFSPLYQAQTPFPLQY